MTFNESGCLIASVPFSVDGNGTASRLVVARKLRPGVLRSGLTSSLLRNCQVPSLLRHLAEYGSANRYRPENN